MREYFGNKVKVIETKASLGCARYLGMRAVDTEWFAFIDSDVRVLPGWFKTVQKYMKYPRIYGVQGVYKENAINKHVQAVLSPRKYMSIKDILKYGIMKYYCASTSNVLLKRDVIQLVNPVFLCGLESGEDLYIAWRIIESDHIYIRINKMQAVHYSSPEMESFMVYPFTYI